MCDEDAYGREAEYVDAEELRSARADLPRPAPLAEGERALCVAVIRQAVRDLNAPYYATTVMDAPADVRSDALDFLVRRERCGAWLAAVGIEWDYWVRQIATFPQWQQLGNLEL